MQVLDKVVSLILAITAIMMLHKTFYSIIGLFIKPRRYPETSEPHNYAIVIAARNEEAVIGNLLDSIKAQTYDQSYLTVFVVADNCNDNTANVCRSKGANVYERFCPEKARKGYALSFLFDKIDRDYGIGVFEGYFIFDADNLLDPSYVAEMNKAFAAGHDVVTSYRSTKNFDTNVISSAYGIHFYRNSMTMHRPRSVLGLGTHLTGTGYLVAGRLLEDGWKYSNLTEDDQLTTILCKDGYKVAYCDAAVFYDEQPIDFMTSFKQRIRWARGRLACFFKHGAIPLRGIFKYKSFSCYDIFTHYFPVGLFTVFVGLVYPVCGIIYGLGGGNGYNFNTMAVNLATALCGQYISFFLTGVLTVIKERKAIKCGFGRLVLYVVCFPWYDMLTLPIVTAAIFSNIKWMPIAHMDTRRIEECMAKTKQVSTSLMS